MSIASTIGKSIGTSAAYAKHAAIATGVGSLQFVQDVRTHTADGYAIKDAELNARRLAAAKARGALPAPAAAKRQRKLVTA